MTRWDKAATDYSDATQHYDHDYFKDQTRDGPLRGIINAWKFEPYLRPGIELLDFGCGDGALLSALCGGNGVEVNPHARAAAQAHGYRIEDTIEAYADDSMDLIVSIHCLEHVEDPLSIIREMRRVIRNDGLIAIVVPCHRVDIAYRENDRDFHLFSWSAANLGNWLNSRGSMSSKLKSYAIAGHQNGGLFIAVLGAAHFMRRRGYGRDLIVHHRKSFVLPSPQNVLNDPIGSLPLLLFKRRRCGEIQPAHDPCTV